MGLLRGRFPAVAAEVLYAPNDSAVALPSYQGSVSGKELWHRRNL